LIRNKKFSVSLSPTSYGIASLFFDDLESRGGEVFVRRLPH